MFPARFAWRRLRASALFCLVLLAIAPPDAGAAAETRADAQPMPTLEALQRELETWRAAPAEDEKARQLTELYAGAVQALGDAAAQREEQARFERLEADAPTRIARAQAGLQEVQRSRSTLAPGGNVARLGRLLAEEKNRLTDLRAQEAEFGSSLASLQARVEDSRLELKALAAAGSADVAPATRAGEADPLRRARLAAWQARQELRVATRARLETETRTLPTRIAALQEQLKLATAQRERAERSVTELLGMENLRRIGEASRLRDEIAARHADAVAPLPELQALQAEVGALAEEHVQIVTRLESERTEVGVAAQKLQELRSNYESTRAQLDIAALNDALGPVLVEHYRKLVEFEQPDRKLASLSMLLSESRLREFQLSQLQHDAPSLREHLEQVVAAATTLDERERREALATADEIQADRDTLLAALARVYTETTGQIVELDNVYQEQAAVAQSFRALLDRNLVWMRSHPPLGFSDLLAWPMQTVSLLVAQDWSGFGRDLVGAMLARPFSLAFALLALLLVLHYRVRLRARLPQLGLRELGWAAYRFPLALEALAIHLLLAAPAPLFALVAGWMLQQMGNASPLAHAVGVSLRDVGLLSYGYLLLLHTFGAEGFARNHLRWRTARVQEVRRWLRLGLWILLPLAFFALLLRGLPGADGPQVARIASLLVSVVFFTLAALTMRAGRGMFDRAFFGRGYPWLRRLGEVLAIGLLLGLPLIVVLDVNGFHFTARQLEFRAFLSIVVLVLTKLVIDTGMLGLALAARRSREALDEETAAETQNAEAENEIDIAKMNKSAVALLHVFAIGVAVLVMIPLWSQFFTALSILDTVQLWGYQTVVDGKEVHASVSLFGLLGALLVLVLSFVLAKGLPALLGLVAYGLITRKGVLFAIQTVLSYAVAVVGVVIALQMLGFGWSKLQWMAAGLSVGLGFGLQEIFANFFAGLIMLFERPVRIGDVVTIGEFSGTISKIRMRATTLTDFDNREVIVPNKMFVTERLINWTLSSSVVRMSFDVGVSYDADPKLVRETLLAILGEDNRILSEPSPVVTFREFGPSSLNFRCSAHIAEVGLKNVVQNDLHMRITELFRERGIEIAYPQMDLHVRTIDAGARSAFGNGEPRGS